MSAVRSPQSAVHSPQSTFYYDRFLIILVMLVILVIQVITIILQKLLSTHIGAVNPI